MTLNELAATIDSRISEKPEGSYVAALVASGPDRVIQKVIEEAGEVIIALKNNDRQKKIEELADLFFHTLIAMNINDLTLADIEAEFSKRKK
jgi:phosphoribosyl-ATP pyrophosphohydrolase